MKIFMGMVLAFFSFGMFCSVENTIEEETKKIFFDLPINDGIEKIKTASGLDFKYKKEEEMFITVEKWEAEVENNNYVKPLPRKNNLIISKGEGLYNEEGYSLSLKLYYEKPADGTKAYQALIEKFEKLGARTEDKSMGAKNGKKKLNIHLVYFDESEKFPMLKFNYSEALVKGEHCMNIHYENYKKKK